MERVLVIQIRQLGDVLLSAPLCRALKENLPDVEVHFLTSRIGEEIVAGNPYIDEVITIENGIFEEFRTIFKVIRNRYDAVLDVQRTGRSRRITFFSLSPLRVAFRKGSSGFVYNRFVDWEDRGYTVWERLKLLEGLGINITDYKSYLPEFFNFKPVESLKIEGDYAVVVPTARKREKFWDSEKFKEVIAFLHRDLKLQVIVLYGKGEEREVGKYRNLGGVTVPERALSIGESASVIRGARLFLGLNSFASHLSVSVGTRTVVIDRKHSGWFPELPLVREVYGNGVFPEVEDVKRAILSLIG